MIIAGKPYELIMRVSNKVPFVALETIRILIESSIARAQRDSKVTICHYLWMGNHPHIILVPNDAQQCVNFYQELQKKITESFKRLTGLKSLRLWDGSAVLSEILDIDKAIDKIAYAYANPSAANLVDRIEEYPGLSTYNAFQSIENTLEASSEVEVPWIRLPSIEPLTSLKLSDYEDRQYANKLRELSTKKHPIKVSPNAWMKAFGIHKAEDVATINSLVFDAIRAKEELARDKRINDNKSVLGARLLKRVRILSECKSKEKERRILFHASTKELRRAFLEKYKEFVAVCRSCYRLLKKGILAEWPPGAFRPPAPPLASAIF